MTNNIALYIHIPFCVKKCDYCAFYSLGGQDEAVKEEYTNALLRQISFFNDERRIGSIYFGGGTPTVLGANRLCRILSAIKERLTLEEDCEITVEVNPKTIDTKGLALLRSNGVNRLSVGIQSANDKMLESIGRIHSFHDAVECIENAKSVGFENISADIIFALPDLKCDMLQESAKAIIDLGVKHISAYSLQLEEGTRLYSRIGSLSLPDEDEEEAQYNALCDIFAKNGFIHYEVSSFCKSGYESRHNLSYWSRVEYFGFGAAAHSFYNGKRFSCVADINRYIELSGKDLFAPTDYANAEAVNERDALEEEIMLSLRTRFGAVLPQKCHEAATRIAKMGYGSFDGKTLSLNSKGFRVSNSIIAEMIEKL